MRIAMMVAVILTVLSLGNANAIEPDKRAMATELLTLMHVEKSAADMRAQLGQMLTAQLPSKDVPEEMRSKVAAMQKKVLDVIFEEIAFEKLKPEYVEVYASTFTADELSGLVAFYKTPVGRAFADKQPVLMQRMMEASQARMQAVIPRIKKMNDEFIADLKKDEPPL